MFVAYSWCYPRAQLGNKAVCSLTKTSWTDLVRKGLGFVAVFPDVYSRAEERPPSFPHPAKNTLKATTVAVCFCPRQDVVSGFMNTFKRKTVSLIQTSASLTSNSSTWSYLNTGLYAFEEIRLIYSILCKHNTLPSRERVCAGSVRRAFCMFLFCALWVKGKCWICLWKKYRAYWDSKNLEY